MEADLNKILKTQRLTDEHIQFFVYQILRGLKVSISTLRSPHTAAAATAVGCFPRVHQQIIHRSAIYSTCREYLTTKVQKIF